MAHIEKYKAHSVGHMLAHYRRDPSCFKRDNIDKDRLGRDWTFVIGPDGLAHKSLEPVLPRWETIAKRIAHVDALAAERGGRKTRKDAVVMADLVVTLPENVPEGREEEFFGRVYHWAAEVFGADNLMGGFVHRDEMETRVKRDKDGRPVLDEDGHKVMEWTGKPIRDHIHIPFTPVVDGRFCFKAMCPRTFYQHFHTRLADYLEAEMGFRPHIELDPEERAKRVYADKTADVDKVKAAVAALTAQEEAKRAEAEQARREAEEGARQAQEAHRAALASAAAARNLAKETAAGWNDWAAQQEAEAKARAEAAEARAAETVARAEAEEKASLERLESVQGRLGEAEAEKSRLERKVQVFEEAIANLRTRLASWLRRAPAAVRQALGLAPVPEAQRRAYGIAEEETRTVGAAWDGGIGHNAPQVERQGRSQSWHR